MAKYLKSITVPLLDLANNFHSLMVEEGASHFTIPKYGKTEFWYITDVRQDGTYPCHPTDRKGNPSYPVYVDYLTNVTIHFGQSN